MEPKGSLGHFPFLLLFMCDAEFGLFIDDPAVFAAEDVEVHGRRIAAEFFAVAYCPF